MVLEIFGMFWLLFFAWVLYVCLFSGCWGFSIILNLLILLFYFIAIAGFIFCFLQEQKN